MKCGKNDCEKPHGPYYYAYWKERIFIDDDKSATCWKTKKKYVGTYLPETERDEKGSS